MIDANTILNTCYQTAIQSRAIARYSHFIPIIISLILGIFVFVKSKFNLFSRVFLSFIVVVCLWLLGDVIAWTSDNYNLVYTTWSFLDYLEIVFFVLGLYFAIVSVKKSDISILSKIALFFLTLPAFYLTITQQSVLGFNQPVCEAFNNDFLGNYKLIVEGIILVVMLVYAINPIFKKISWKKKKVDLIVIGSMFLFLSTFGITEYLASTTGYYEMNLYSLFLLPVFLIVIIYSVFELDIFNFHILGTHYLVVGLVILSGGQLFFTSSATDKLLTSLTIVLTIFLSIILFKNLKRESDQRVRIEKLSVQLEASNANLEIANDKLKGLDRLKTEFLSLASHQLRSPLTAIKGYTSMLLEGSYGEVSPTQKETINKVFESSQHLSKVVEDLLNVSKIEQGGMVFEFAQVDIEKLVKDLVSDFELTAQKKGLKISFETDKKESYIARADLEKFRQVVLNLIDNSIKYTKEGFVKVSLERPADKILIKISDSGMGVSPETKAKLFEKFSRGEAGKTNTGGSGLGLYLAKEIVTAHGGTISIDSEGLGKGSTFTIEIKSA